MEYLDDFVPLYHAFVPPPKTKTQAERDLEWQNEGHDGITEDFSGDKTPQEREDDKLQRM